MKEGAVERVRLKMMTVVAIMAGLLPIMWGTGTVSEVMSLIVALQGKRAGFFESTAVEGNIHVTLAAGCRKNAY